MMGRFQRMRGPARKAIEAIALGFVAFGIPWLVGSRFLSPFVLIPLACLSVFTVADLAAGSPKRAGACILRGWGFGAAFLFLGVIGLNVQIPGPLLLPRAEILADALGLSFTACVLTAGVTLHLAAKTGPGATRLIMKLAIVLVTVLSIYGCNRWQTEGTFLLTTRTITWITAIAGTAMFVIGTGLLLLPARPKQ